MYLSDQAWVEGGGRSIISSPIRCFIVVGHALASLANYTPKVFPAIGVISPSSDNVDDLRALFFSTSKHHLPRLNCKMGLKLYCITKGILRLTPLHAFLDHAMSQVPKLRWQQN